MTIVCCGTMINEVLAAADILAAQGISAEIIKIGTIDKADYPVCIASAAKTGCLIAAEEVCGAGCLGERILAQVANKGLGLKHARLLNLKEGIVPHGDRAALMRDMGIDAASIAKTARALCGR